MGMQVEAVKINVRAFKDSKGNSFALAFTTDGTPLLIATKSREGTFAWQEVTIRSLADAQDVVVNAMFHLQNINDPNYVRNYTNIVNQAQLAGELNEGQVFKNFTDPDLKKVLDNWDSIQAALNKGEVPSGFNYNWRFADQSIPFAKKNGMKIRAENLLRGGDVPDTLYKGKYTNDELWKIAEFMVKARVLKYKGQIDEWTGPYEMVASKLYGVGKWRFWVDRFGYGICSQVIKWAFEVDPNLKMSVVEDLPTADRDFPPEWRQWIPEFFEFLRQIKANVPTDQFKKVRVDIEHNEWIYAWSYDNPETNVNTFISVLQQIKDLGYDLSASETTVPTSDVWPIWNQRPKKPENVVKDKEKAKAQVYKGIMKAHFAVGGKEIGFGGISGDTEWYQYTPYPPQNSMILDNRQQHTQAYYAVLQILLEQLQANQR